MQEQATDNVNNKVAIRLITYQSAITLLSYLLGFIFGGAFIAKSAGLGGAVAVIGTVVMAIITFAAKDMSPKQMLFAFYLGEATKVCITIGLFIGVFVFLDVHVLYFMLSYIATLMVNWLCFLIGN